MVKVQLVALSFSLFRNRRISRHDSNSSHQRRKGQKGGTSKSPTFLDDVSGATLALMAALTGLRG